MFPRKGFTLLNKSLCDNVHTHRSVEQSESYFKSRINSQYNLSIHTPSRTTANLALNLEFYATARIGQVSERHNYSYTRVSAHISI